MRHKLLLIVLMLATFVLTGCITFRKVEIPKPKTECREDQDCSTGGCGGEICGPKEKVKNVVTICIDLPEYQCLKMTSCRCLDGKCQWEKTEEFKKCLANYNRDPKDFDFKE